MNIERATPGLALLILATFGAPWVTAQDPPNQPIHTRLIWEEAPQTRARIAWSTPAPGDWHRVYYDTESRGGDPSEYSFQLDCQDNGKYSADEPVLYYHQALLTDLEPSTVYYLVLASDDQLTPEFRFETAPETDRSFAILWGGDSRSGRQSRQQMNRRIAGLVHEDPSILALAHGGDYIYSGRNFGQWVAWMEDHELTRAGDRLLPIIPARGNHEAAGPLYDEVFGWPGGGLRRNYFATTLSPEVLWITLNTETAAGGDQAEFLDRTLKQNRASRWQVVQYHRPIWPAFKRPAGAKQHWQPLFDEHRVDLVCEADGHVIKRTVPIRGEEQHPEGVVYIGEGGLGVKQRTPRTDRWFIQEPGYAANGHHVWRLRFGNDALELEAILLVGGIADRHRLLPRSR